MAYRIALIGFMGSGKTTVGRRLADLLAVPFIEVDDLIVARSKRPSVRDIFELDGEAEFRRLESAVAEDLSSVREGIISTGGGLVMNPENLRSLRAAPCTIVYLKASFQTICRRLEGDQDRPLFQDRTRAADLYGARFALYEAAADLVLETEGRTPEQIASLIAEHVQ